MQLPRATGRWPNLSGSSISSHPLSSEPLTLRLHNPATIPALSFLQRAVLTPSLGLLMSSDSGGEQVMDVKRRDLILLNGPMAVVIIMAGGRSPCRHLPDGAETH